MKEFLQNAIDTIKDDRFSWRFKLCNIIMNDKLRENIAFPAARIEQATEHLEYFAEQTEIPKWRIEQLKRSVNELREIFRL